MRILALGLLLTAALCNAAKAQDRLNYYSHDFGVNSAQAVPGSRFDLAVRELGVPKTVVRRSTTPLQQPEKRVGTHKKNQPTSITTDGLGNIRFEQGNSVNTEKLWPTR